MPKSQSRSLAALLPNTRNKQKFHFFRLSLRKHSEDLVLLRSLPARSGENLCGVLITCDLLAPFWSLQFVQI